MRMPRQFLFLEDKLKKQVSRYIQRGKVDIFLTVEGEGLVQRTLQVDWTLLEEFYQRHAEAQKRLQVTQPLSLDRLLLHPDVATILEKEIQSENLATDILATTEKAAIELLQMRQKEGSALALDFKQRLSKVRSLALDISQQAPKVVEAYHNRLVKRVVEFLDGKIEIEEGRLLTEVAIFADKSEY
ncbi:YicC/YloC family endoribonuclease [Anaerobacillus sp. CMMVII]|uniref:YicC/YloC family endoribonuclease n=1 Tax=Anaerobacillus sp. CMMVII TaxID=2755588 RepID=UPI0021B83122|nr:YicC/YloC family endoribonuclease [Anaerobacillus sp. CMMVII]